MRLKNLQYQYVPVNLLKGEQLSPEYCKINPNKTVPSLFLDDGRAIIQSVSILEYLEDAFPESMRLLPSDTFDRATVRMIVSLIAVYLLFLPCY